MRSFVPILSLLVLGRVGAESNYETIWKGFSVSCIKDESGQVVSNASVSCHGIRLVRKIVQKLLEDARKKKNMEFIHGITLVEVGDGRQSSRDARFSKDYGFMGTIVKWLEGRELRINLPTLLPVNLVSVIEQSLPSNDEGRKSGGGFGGGLGGKGDGGAMLVALMMGKMMAAMGFGALGLLAMKALMISALALMLSLIVAAKKMSGGKDEESHHVVYAQEVHGHHRRRRSLENDKNYPYRGYVILPTDTTKITQ
ncbi:uncharacterized protein LOC131665684 [Phymastichus coffea]|uniref:uncharacterized protein LOC131665684 n=1 Tax=Phymastichus coffea TaxID=108790 RepID=UPI00273CD57C|nr:uncharacterized protein LOC131665684 [Phymastichus coffea]